MLLKGGNLWRTFERVIVADRKRERARDGTTQDVGGFSESGSTPNFSMSFLA